MHNENIDLCYMLLMKHEFTCVELICLFVSYLIIIIKSTLNSINTVYNNY